MTKDFSKKRQPAQKTRNYTPNRRTATKKKQKAMPAWFWVLVGMFLGALLVILLHLIIVKPKQSDSVHTAPQTDSTKQPQPRFDFYKLLKDQELTLPDNATELADTPTQDTLYLLQVGSFRNNEDADRLRAQLLLLNLAVTVEKVRSRNGDDWHRVIVGPFKSRSKLAKARSILASNEISSLLLKRRDIEAEAVNTD